MDLGTAAAFRAQWGQEAGAPKSPTPPLPLLLKIDQAPGDAVAATAAIHSLHRAHPGRYRTAVESRWPEVFLHNPDVSLQESGAAELRMHYPAIHQSNERGIHFMQGWCEHLGAALDVQVPLLTDRPRLYFDCDAPPVEDFWVVCSGGKGDFTNKLWGRDNYQAVVDRLGYHWKRESQPPKVRFVQVGGVGHDHPPLCGVEYVVGQTTLRQLFALVRQARGVLCGVSLLMHVAAALEKPAVVVAGGREPVAWNAYPRQHYLHTVGALPCADPAGRVGGACWRSRVVPLGDSPELDKQPCCYPVRRGDSHIPECMSAIRPEAVADLVFQLNRQIRYK